MSARNTAHNELHWHHLYIVRYRINDKNDQTKIFLHSLSLSHSHRFTGTHPFHLPSTSFAVTHSKFIRCGFLIIWSLSFFLYTYDMVHYDVLSVIGLNDTIWAYIHAHTHTHITECYGISELWQKLSQANRQQN